VHEREGSQTEHEQMVRRGFDAFETADMDAFMADWHHCAECHAKDD
jgi:hypothetical protein